MHGRQFSRFGPSFIRGEKGGAFSLLPFFAGLIGYLSA